MVFSLLKAFQFIFILQEAQNLSSLLYRTIRLQVSVFASTLPKIPNSNQILKVAILCPEFRIGHSGDGINKGIRHGQLVTVSQFRGKIRRHVIDRHKTKFG